MSSCCKEDLLAKEASVRLQQHVAQLAQNCLDRHGELNRLNLESVLSDRDCVRYPAKIAFNRKYLETHQFAQPEFDDKNEQLILYLDPSLEDNYDAVLLAVSYMIPVINYGEAVADKHCAIFGAALLGLKLEEYVKLILELAEGLMLEKSG